MKSKQSAVRIAVPSVLHSLNIAILLVAGLAPTSEARLRDRYRMVTHTCGAVEWYVPVQNLIVVAFAPGASEEANFALAQAEGFLVRTIPEETVRDGMAIYALPPGEGLAGAMERVLQHGDVQAVMPALVPEAGTKVLFLHPGSFTATLNTKTSAAQQQVIDQIRTELGLESERTKLNVPTLQRASQVAKQTPPNLLEVWVPPGGDLFDEMARVTKLPAVLGVGVKDVKSKLSEHNDSYLVEGERRQVWYVARTYDGGSYTEVRHDYLEVDSLLVVEFTRPPTPTELTSLQEFYALRPADAAVPVYAEIEPGLRDRMMIMAIADDAAKVCRRLVGERSDLVRGALPGYYRPHHELQTVEYLRPRNFIIEYLPEANPLEIKLMLQSRNLEEIRRAVDEELKLLVVEVAMPATAEDLFASIRGVRQDENVVNVRPIIAVTDNEVQLVVGHRYDRAEPYLTYVDQERQTVRLFPHDRLIVLSFAAGSTAAEREAAATEFGIHLVPARQNLNVRDTHDVYGVAAGGSSVEVARRIRAAGASDILVGASPVLLDSDSGRLVFGPESWLRVAFEPKTPQRTVDQILERHGLQPAFDPHRSVEDDPYLDLRGGFWNFYISRRIPLITPRDVNLGALLTTLNREAAVIWAHPYSLSPALDRGSRLVMSNIGTGWYRHDRLDAYLNMIIHLVRTTSWKIVEGYIERAGLKLENDRLPVMVEPRPDSSTLDISQALGSVDFELAVDDGQRLFGMVGIDALYELGDIPGIGMVLAKETVQSPQR